jgi:hypothetical protein
MKSKLLSVFILITLFTKAYCNDYYMGQLGYEEYYCFETFSDLSPNYPMWISDFGNGDKISLYVLSGTEFILRQEYTGSGTNEGSTYSMNYSILYEDCLNYGDVLSYKAVLSDKYWDSTAKVWKTSTKTVLFSIRITRFNQDVTTEQIEQVCNTLSFDGSRNLDETYYGWFYSETGDETSYTGISSEQKITISNVGYYKIRVTPKNCRSVWFFKNININNIYKNDITGGKINQVSNPVCDNVNLDISEGKASTGGDQFYTYEWYNSDNNSLWTKLAQSGKEVTILPQNVKSYLKRKVFSCNSTISAESNVIELIKTPGLTNAGTISTDQSICFNITPAKLTGTAATGGGSVIYLWQYSLDNSNWNDITGSNLLDYSPGKLTKTTYYRRKVTSSCGDGYSNTVTIVVYPEFIAGSIGNDQTICYNTSPNKIVGVLAIGGAGNYSYDWEYSLDNNNWHSLGISGKDYQPPLLTETTYYRRKVTDNCVTSYSNTCVISVNDELGQINISGEQSICYGYSVSTLQGETPTGGDGTFTFKWQKSTDNKNWSDIVNSNSRDYTPVNVTVSTYYRRITSTTSCGIATSNVVKVTVSDEILPGTISLSQSICDGVVPSELIGTQVNAVTYQWQSSPNGSNWENIAGANNQNWQPDALKTSKYYRRQVITACGSENSNSVFITVYPAPLQPSVEGLESVYCKGSAVNLSINGSYTYKWYDNEGTLINTGKTYDINPIESTREISVRAVDANNCSSEAFKITAIVENVMAGFTVNSTSIYKAEFVQFTNQSINATSYLWNFFEGENSTKESPLKYYYTPGLKDVKLTAMSQNGCKDSLIKQDYIDVTGPTGIEDLHNTELMFYPNPVEDYLNFESPSTGSYIITVVNLTGETVIKREIINMNKIAIDCQSLLHGVYIARVQNKKEVLNFKFVKK